MSFSVKDWTVLASVAGFILLGVAYSCVNEGAHPRPAQAPATQEQVFNSYTPEQLQSASAILAAAKGNARIFEDAGSLVVECREFIAPYDINARLRYVRSICDADAILHGRPRPIYFYDPNGKQFAKADPRNGIRLTE